MDNFIVTGILLGLSAGVAPGPLLALVISETLQHGTRSGVKVALAPIITDLPIIAVSLFLVSRLGDYRPLLGVVSLAGACFLLYLAYDCFRSKGVQLPLEEGEKKSLAKGVITNTLSPHPFLFWFTVGAPIIVKAWKSGPLVPLHFIGGFYLLLVGSKIFLALIVGKSRTFLQGRVYGYALRLLGVSLAALAFLLFVDGLEFFGVV